MAFDDDRARCCEGLGAAASCSSDDHSGWWGFASVMNDGGAYDGKPETIMDTAQAVTQPEFWCYKG